MGSVLHLAFADYGKDDMPYGEVSRTRVPGPPITAATHDAIIAEMTSLAAAIKAVQLGKEIEQEFVHSVTKPEAGPASTPLAQREKKWLILYHDTTTLKKYRCTIPCADLTLLKTNSEAMDLTAGVGATLKATFETYCKVEISGAYHDVAIDSVIFVGRNL
jgi:hypothetical protein